MIRWTNSKEVIDRPATLEEIDYARDQAVDLLHALNEHKGLRARVMKTLDSEEAQLAQALEGALKRSQRRVVGVHAVVGYDLANLEKVLADPQTQTELRRVPLTDAERRIAEKMPHPAVQTP